MYALTAAMVFIQLHDFVAIEIYLKILDFVSMATILEILILLLIVLYAHLR